MGDTARVRLPDVLDALSPAERSVLLLDGDCVPVGLSVALADVPPSAAVRAASLAPATARHDLVVELQTAAWVHGALAALPGRLTVAVDARAGRRTRQAPGRPRQAWFRAEDAPRLGGVRVATPLKTAFDLLRLEPGPESEAIAGRLLRIAGLTPALAAALAQLQPAAHHKPRAIAALAALRP